LALIRAILFPVSFSHSCIAMGAFVRRAASMMGARVSLLHVVDPASYNALEMYLRSPTDVAEDHIEAARGRLDTFLSTEFPPSECPRIVTNGEPARQIAATAATGFDAIMMPTHAGAFRRMLLGSTTAKVLNDSDIPIITSHHAETIAPRPLEHREWLCAVGLGEDSERVLRFAHQISMEAGAHLRIIHAIQAADPTLPVQLDLEEAIQSEERQEAHARIDELQQRVGSRASVRIAVGPVKDALLEAARQSDADALLIGRSPRPGPEGRLRDLTYAMVRDSPFPVMSI
jgi:nucleotide-binding universal stress UspA family protein